MIQRDIILKYYGFINNRHRPSNSILKGWILQAKVKDLETEFFARRAKNFDSSVSGVVCKETLLVFLKTNSDNDKIGLKIFTLFISLTY
jgi:hypothetical protein